MGRYFDRRGFPIEMMEWAEEFEKRPDHLRESWHKEGGKEFWLSTVWIGLDHSFGQGPPLIYETMAFQLKPKAWNDVIGELDFSGLYQNRYSTEDQALAGHDPWEVIRADRRYRRSYLGRRIYDQLHARLRNRRAFHLLRRAKKKPR